MMRGNRWIVNFLAVAIISSTFILSVRNDHGNRQTSFIKSSGRDCGILFTLGLNTPLIKQYEERWSELAGRGPYISELLDALQQAHATQSLPIAIVTDAPESMLRNAAPEFYENASVIHSDFNDVKYGWGDKISAFKVSPFHKTIAFDADVTLCKDISHVCEFLDFYDIAMAREPFLKQEWLKEKSNPGMKHFYKYLKNLNFHNSGLVMFRKSEKTQALFDSWQQVHNKKGGGDQNILADLLHEHTNIRHLELPTEYNFRAHQGIGPIAVLGDVFAIHARSTCLNCTFVNLNTCARLISPTACKMYELQHDGLFHEFSSTYRKGTERAVKREKELNRTSHDTKESGSKAT